jgi:iron complex outermembrane recepter protein
MTKLGLMTRLTVALSVVNGAIALGALPVVAQEVGNGEAGSGKREEQFASTPDPRLPTPGSLSDFDQMTTTVEDWLAQIEASLVQIIGVRVEETEAGLQLVLETENDSFEVPETRTVGNALIADIPNATIAEAFSQANPIEGIALVSVTGLPGDRVQVAITGTDAPPVAEVSAEAQGLVLAVTLGDAESTVEEDAIQVVVTGEQDDGYNPSEASTATRTDTPLRDIPQSITVVPRQVLEDRNVRTITEAVETVSGVVQGESFFGVQGVSNLIIRGFSQDFGGESSTFRNGARDGGFAAVRPIGTIEQVEVLRGPASVLFGALEPGGIVNVITRQPLSEPYYNLAVEVGNYDFYQPTIDLSAPLVQDDTLLYRFIASYQSAGSYQDFVEIDQVAIAPSITLNLGDRTRLNLYYEYADYEGSPAFQADSPLRSDGSFLPRNFYPGYPDLNTQRFTTHRFGYTLNHEFNDNWQIRNNLAAALTDSVERRSVPNGPLLDDRFITNLYTNDATSASISTASRGTM